MVQRSAPTRRSIGFQSAEYSILSSRGVIGCGGWRKLNSSTLQLDLVRGVRGDPTLFGSPMSGSTAERYSRKMNPDPSSGQWFNAGCSAVLICTARVESAAVYVTAFGMAVV